jgi:hypothetical protein
MFFFYKLQMNSMLIKNEFFSFVSVRLRHGIFNINEAKIQLYRSIFKLIPFEPFICGTKLPKKNKQPTISKSHQKNWSLRFIDFKPARECIYKKYEGLFLFWEHFFCFVSNDWEDATKQPKRKVTNQHKQ